MNLETCDRIIYDEKYVISNVSGKDYKFIWYLRKCLNIQCKKIIDFVQKFKKNPKSCHIRQYILIS